MVRRDREVDLPRLDVVHLSVILRCHEVGRGCVLEPAVGRERRDTVARGYVAEELPPALREDLGLVVVALLFHRLVQRAPVLFLHLVHLIDGGDPHIRENQRTGLERPPPVAELVLDRRRRQTGGCRRLAARVDPAGREFHDVPQDLTLCDTRVADQQDVNVAAETGAVRHILRDTAEELERDRLLHVVGTVDRRRDRPGDLLVDHGVAGERHDIRLVLLGDRDLLELLLGDLDGVALEIDVKERALLAVVDPLHRPEDAVQHHPVARRDHAGQVVGDVDIERLGLLAAPEAFRGLLDPEFLGVDEPAPVHHQVETGLPLAVRAEVGLVEPPVTLRNRVGVLAAGAAPEDCADDPGAHLGGLSENSLEGDESVDLVGPDVADVGLLRQVREPDVDQVGVLAVFQFEKFVLDDRVPDISENLSGAPQKFEREFVIQDLAVIDEERVLVGVLAGEFGKLALVLLLQELRPLTDVVGNFDGYLFSQDRILSGAALRRGRTVRAAPPSGYRCSPLPRGGNRSRRGRRSVSL